jgi:outer membrane protein TolC
MTTLGVVASQDLSWPGRRSLRAEVALRDAALVDAQLARARLSVAASVRTAYHSLREARALLELSREQVELARQVEAAVRARYGVGRGSQADLLRVQVEVTRRAQTALEQEAEQTALEAELNQLLGRTGGQVETPAAPAPAPAEPLEVALARLRETSPELAAARTAVERAELAVQLARSAGKPDFTVEAGYMNRGGLDPMWQARFGVRLPAPRAARRAALEEAEASLRAARARVEAVDSRLRFRTAERLARLATLARLASLYEDGVVPQGRLALTASLAGYRSGRTPYRSVLEAMAALYADRAALARLAGAAGRLQARLEEASLDAAAEMPVLGVPAAGLAAMDGPPMPDAPPAAAPEPTSVGTTAGMPR